MRLGFKRDVERIHGARTISEALISHRLEAFGNFALAGPRKLSSHGFVFRFNC